MGPKTRCIVKKRPLDSWQPYLECHHYLTNIRAGGPPTARQSQLAERTQDGTSDGGLVSHVRLPELDHLTFVSRQP